ncbi:MAG: hypothetical protein M1820_010030 [Bogoriella megaspora]|nr:MAG: hypothetical protein M1820_010030 [Bogoriella megaspora]
MDDPPLASLSLTHVHYNPYDRVSYVCAWLALVPQALCVTYATLIWSTREAEILLMFAGQMGCEAFNWLLKRWIKEERPKLLLQVEITELMDLPLPEMNGKGYGMPSSHAQFLAFFSIYLSLFLLFRHNPTSSPDHSHNHPITLTHRILISLGSLAAAAGVAGSRIYLNYHTPRQVLVGCAAGVVTAVGWFIVTEIARRQGWLHWAMEHPWVRWARVRDLVVSEDLVDAGWARWEGRKGKRSLSNGIANGKKSR